MARIIPERSDILPLLEDVFVEYGYDGATISLIEDRTGLGKGSLYHFFPGGKEEMAREVLKYQEDWFHIQIYTPLNEIENPIEAIDQMFQNLDDYYNERSICLFASVSMHRTRDRFLSHTKDHFLDWLKMLSKTLNKQIKSRGRAWNLSEDILAEIQGAMILSRAFQDERTFKRVIRRARAKIAFELEAETNP